MKPKFNCLLLATVSSMIALSSSAFAAIQYWDGTANVTIASSDNTNTAPQNWFSDGLWDNGTTSATLGSWTSGDSAVFGGTATSQTITAGTLTIGNMTFGSGALGAGTSGTAYTITGGAITLGSSTVTVAQNSNTTIATNLFGGTLSKLGLGKLTLSGTNTYNSGTAINGGTVSVIVIADSGTSNLGTSGYIGLNNGTLEYTGTGTSTTGRALWVDQGSGGTFDITQSTGVLSFTGNTGTMNKAIIKKGAGTMNSSHVISGSASVTVEAGTLKLTGTNSYSGTTTINGGTLAVVGQQGWEANGSRVGNTVVVNNGGTLRTDGNHQFGWDGTLANLTVNNGGTFNQNSMDHYLGTLTLNGNATLSNGSGHYLGLSGGVVNYTGTSTQQTTVGSSLRLRNTAGGTVNSTFTVTGTNTAGDLVVSGAIQDGGGLTKEGTGTLVLSSNSNSYTGATNVNKGTLVISGNISTSVTTVKSGATISGSGTTGALTIESGGFVSPGNSPGILTTKSLVIAGTYNSELGGIVAGTSYDQINVTGTVTLSGLLALTSSFTPANGDLFFIIKNDGLDAITGTFTGLADGAKFMSGSQKYQISYSGNAEGTPTFTGGNDVALKAIPEPSAVLLGSLGLLALLRRRR